MLKFCNFMDGSKTSDLFGSFEVKTLEKSFSLHQVSQTGKESCYSFQIVQKITVFENV